MVSRVNGIIPVAKDYFYRARIISFYEIILPFLKLSEYCGCYLEDNFGSIYQSHADAVQSLNEWWRKTKKSDWSSLPEIKKSFNSVDYVGNDRYVFNIKGKKYRIVAMIFFDIRTVYIRFVGTHTEYDKVDCKTI